MDPLTVGPVEHEILLLRGHRVMLDFDLARLYGVPIKTFNRTVNRRSSRFPPDFMFQLTKEETRLLRSRFEPLAVRGRGKYSKYAPHAFTEHGVAMLSSVLNSERAIQVNIAIVRAFAKLRRMLASNEDLARKLAELETRYDAQFKVVFDAIRELMEPAESPPVEIGFKP